MADILFLEELLQISQFITSFSTPSIGLAVIDIGTLVIDHFNFFLGGRGVISSLKNMFWLPKSKA